MPRIIQPTSEISKDMQEYRELTESSVKAYTGSLRMLFKTANPDDDLTKELSLEFLDDFDGMMKIINSMDKITTKKNRLTAILVGLQSTSSPNDKLISKYSNELQKFGKKYSKIQDKQGKTETQEKNWIEMSDFIKAINNIMKDVKNRKKEGDWSKNQKLSKKDYNLLQSLVLLSTYQDFPLRNDFADMKVMSEAEYDDMKDEEKDAGNYLVKSSKNKKLFTFKINKYKNVKRLGRRSYIASKKLSKLLNLWFRHNKSGYFLTLQNQITPLSRNGLTKLLQKIMFERTGKVIGSSMLRHIQISHARKDDKSITQKQKENLEIEDKFLHSAEMNDQYRKL